ncbi:hydrolase [Mediterraneibacter butyricigenes]|uniref:bis(5'-nucleosyl)-tetraphosphatase (symmetrical) n=1 Tax=Mediterraneibacter butyricigenes TaxID=2316025 RepID=A0A391PGD6_9FIRM|nr:bis(5'-nucleosyl)-tetraphosphatase (symmetrical) YqeK [Mediterraneibacter butyricigenes]GCA65632.1 hydrolase [Mediterraneibacter butyricigenes]
MENQKIQECLKKKLSEKRYEHTIGVMYTSAALAMAHHGDVQKAMKAGLLHDCGKYGSAQEQVERCRKQGITLTESEEKIPALAHAKLGAYFAREKYEVADKEILDAILYHTTGRADMSLMEKILYVADYMEPGRKMIPGLEEIRYEAFHDLDKAVALATRGSITYLEKQGRLIDPASYETWKFYKSKADWGCRLDGSVLVR